MRFKKGFTLSEILIVLVLIGFIASMTVPGMMKNVQETQIKTGFKKGYKKAAEYYMLSAKQGFEPSQEMLGKMFITGKVFKKIPFKWFIMGLKSMFNENN